MFRLSQGLWGDSRVENGHTYADAVEIILNAASAGIILKAFKDPSGADRLEVWRTGGDDQPEVEPRLIYHVLAQPRS